MERSWRTCQLSDASRVEVLGSNSAHDSQAFHPLEVGELVPDMSGKKKHRLATSGRYRKCRMDDESHFYGTSVFTCIGFSQESDTASRMSLLRCDWKNRLIRGRNSTFLQTLANPQDVDPVARAPKCCRAATWCVLSQTAFKSSQLDWSHTASLSSRICGSPEMISKVGWEAKMRPSFRKIRHVRCLNNLTYQH